MFSSHLMIRQEKNRTFELGLKNYFFVNIMLKPNPNRGIVQSSKRYSTFKVF